MNGNVINGEPLNDTNNDSLEFESPLYDYLEANIPKPMMQYSDTPFPDHYPLYPSHEETLEYLERYADPLKSLIRFNTQVQSVKPVNQMSGLGSCKWEVVSKNLTSSSVSKCVYDAVIVANGHYTVPHVVSIFGVDEWNKAYPGSIIHSKAYRLPDTFKGQRVLVIGNSASGTDIAFQVGTTSSKLFLASRSESIFSTDTMTPWKEDVDEVVEFLPAHKYTRAVKTKSGRVLDNIDIVIFATGYFFSFPFMLELDPPIITDGLRTRDVYQHFLHIEHPSLALPVLNHKIVPFGLAENQAAVIARMWSGRLPVPSREKMRNWEQEALKTNGTGKHFHLKKFPGEAVQMNELYSWALSATPRPGLENDGVGKLGWPWDQRKVWMRSKFMNFKTAYNDKGDDRRKVRKLEDLGFSYDLWRRHAKAEDMTVFKEAKCPS